MFLVIIQLDLSPYRPLYLIIITNEFGLNQHHTL